MKFTQATLIALPLLVSAGSRDRTSLGDRVGNRDRTSLGDRTGNRAGLLGDTSSAIVEPVCNVLEEQISDVGVGNVVCQCTQDSLTDVTFSCEIPNVDLPFSDNKAFSGDFGITGSFALNFFDKSYTLGLGSCYNGLMTVTGIDEPQVMSGCAEVKICPDEDGNFDEFCECGGTISGYDCTCDPCSDGNTGVVFNCGDLPFPLELCFPSAEIPL